ncbi:hypothetical protein BH23BAC1_BH23BAC1_48340 [soil metagenome]
MGTVTYFPLLENFILTSSRDEKPERETLSNEMQDYYQIPQTKKGILFIPDISGFTNFVNHTEASHSQHIISELLELIIAEVKDEFQISEIEGDAILFYKFANSFDLAAIIDLCQRIFMNFHSHLKNYQRDLVCHCGACSMANRLGLKFIIHIGHFGIHEVSTREKLYGKEVIFAHRLLKNHVVLSEYILLSTLDALNIEIPFESIEEEVEGYGPINIKLLDLTPLKKDIPEPLQRPVETFPKVSRMVFETVPAISFQELVLAITEPEERMQWMENVSKIKLKGHKINRIKTEHECVINGNVVEVTLEELVSGENEMKILESASLRAPVMEMYQLFSITKMENEKVVIGMGTALKDLKNPVFKIFKPIIEKYLAYKNSKSLRSLADYLNVSHSQKL